MAQNLPIKNWHTIGEHSITRRGVSYTPATDMTLRHFSFVGRKNINANVGITGYTFTDMDAITWEIRADAGSGNKPGTATALATGTFDWRNNTEWKTWRPIKYTVNLATPLALTASTRYWFILKTYEDATAPYYPIAWSDYYDTGASGEVDSAVYTSYYFGAAWSTGTNAYNLTLYVLDEQAGSMWHVVMDGNGYKMPDNMTGYRCEQVASGLAQSRGGQSDYSQLRYPYSNQSQSTWTTGAGQLTVEDLAAYLNSISVDTTVPNQALIGPMSFRTGTDNSLTPYYDPTTIIERSLPDTDKGTEAAAIKYYAQKFTAPTGGTSMTTLGVRVSKKHWSGEDSLHVALYSDTAGTPNAAVSSWVALTPTFRRGWVDAAITYSLVSETAYWVVVRVTSTLAHSPEYQVVFDTTGSATGGVAKYSAAGSSWTALTGYSMAFRVNYAPAGQLADTVTVIKFGDLAGTGTLACAAGKYIYTWNNSTGYWTDISAGIEGAGSTKTTANITDIIFFDNKLVVAQGYANPMYVYNGTSWSGAAALNMVNNGNFDSTVSWSKSAVTTFTSIAGGQSGNCAKVLCNSSAGPWAYLYQTFTVTAGTQYTFSCYHKNGGGPNENAILIGTAAFDTTYWDSTALNDANWALKTKTFTATGTTVVVTLAAGNGLNTYGLFDTVTLQAAAPGGKYLHVGKGFLWASTGINTVARTNSMSSWTANITVGENLWEINSIVSYSGKILVGKEDGIWEVDSNDLATEYLPFKEHANANNCKGMTVWSGMLFVPVQNAVWRWQGSQYKDVGPTAVFSGPTAQWPNKTTRFASTPPFLFASATPVVSTGYGGLMAYNGLGWHHIATHQNANLACNAICATSEIGADQVRIWFGEGEWISYITLPIFTNNRYDWASATYDTSGGTLVHSWWDGGLKDALKFWNRLTLIADIPTNTSIEVYVGRDGAEWTSDTDYLFLGEVTNQQLEDDGEYTLMFPDGIVAKSISVVLYLKTNVSTATPRVRALNIESVVRQIPVYAYTYRILLADNITKLDGTTETRDADDMWEELQRIAAKNEPIIVSFPNKSIRGLVSALREETVAYKPDTMDTQKWERNAIVSVIEAL